MKFLNLSNVLTAGAAASVAAGIGTLVYYQSTNPNFSSQQSSPQTEEEIKAAITKVLEKNSQISEGKKTLEDLVIKKDATTLAVETLGKEIEEATAGINGWQTLIEASSANLSRLTDLKATAQQLITSAQAAHEQQKSEVQAAQQKVTEHQQVVDKSTTERDQSLAEKGKAEIALFTHTQSLSQSKKALEEFLAKLKTPQNPTEGQVKQQQQQQQQQQLSKEVDELTSKTDGINKTEEDAKKDYEQKKASFDSALQTQLKNNMDLLSQQHKLKLTQFDWDQAKEKHQQIEKEMGVETQNNQNLTKEKQAAVASKDAKEAQKKEKEHKLKKEEQEVKQQEESVAKVLNS